MPAKTVLDNAGKYASIITIENVSFGEMSCELSFQCIRHVIAFRSISHVVHENGYIGVVSQCLKMDVLPFSDGTGPFFSGTEILFKFFLHKDSSSERKTARTDGTSLPHRHPCRV